MNIKLIVFDIDGTLTDGKIYIGNNGECFKAFNVKDGYGISVILKNKGIEPVIITGRKSDIVDIRCNELGITRIYQGVDDKFEALKHLLEELNLSYNAVAYMGDDIPDLRCMEAAKISGCPCDAVNAVKEKAKFISHYKGGEGAVREFIDWLVDYNE